ncbi:transcription antitermination factor NusB [uncultured Albimonas sp.]|uniref:transcription antitermination factor NusB n=1 Tax=uncultured Albimonas sp. TaxID=1331701 RepID=UPI0030ECD9AE
MTDTPETPEPAPAPRPEPSRQEKKLMRSAARLAAVQALFQMEKSGEDWREIRREFVNHRFGHSIEGEEYREADPYLFESILEGAVNRQAQIDQTTNVALDDAWPIHRIDPTLRAIFRAAGAELFDSTVTPPRVIISEFVDVARAFFPEGKEGGFVNAVLDKVARQARPTDFA